MEQLITVPLEQNLLNGVAWLDDINSQSITGLSSIVMIFEPGTDPLRARQMVAERLTQAHMLPAVSKPPTMLQPLSSASRVIMVRLSSAELSTIQTSVLARWTIRPALMGVPGVANVSIWGQRERQLQVQVDPQLLNDRGVLLEQIVATTGNALWVSPLKFLEASSPGTGGFIDTANQRIGVQHLLPIDSPEDLALVPIEGCATAYGQQTEAGASVCPTIGDVATVVENHQPLIGDAVATDGESLLLVIEKFPDADTGAVTNGVEDTLAGMAPGLDGVVIDTTVFQRANLIESVVENFSRVLLIGLVLAILVVFLMLFDWRSAVISAVTIPLSVVTAGLVLYLRGAEFNTLIAAGMVVALGIIIDDVVADVENIRRRLHAHRIEGKSDASTSSVVAEAVIEARRPILAATVIVLLAAVPILLLGGMFDSFFLGGQSGTFFQPLVLSYVLAVVASLLVSLIVTPTLATLLLSRAPQAPAASPLMSWLQPRYGRLLGRTVPVYGLSAAIMAILLAVGLAILPQLQQPDAIVPPAEDRDLLISWEAASGTSLPEMTRITSRISAELQALPGVENVGAHVGRALTSDQVVDVNSGELWVSIDDSADYDGTLAAVTGVVQGYPGLNHVVQTYLEDRLASVQTSPDDIVVRLYGQDMDVLQARAEEVQGALGGLDGVNNARLDLQVREPQIQVEVDLAAAEQYGLVPGDVRRTAATLVTGLEVGSLFEDQKVFEVMVVGVPQMRQSLTTIENILIDTPDGEQVRLGDVASVQVVPALDSIRHDAVSRYVDVLANVNGRSIGAVVSELETHLAGVDLPLDYRAEVLGDYVESENVERQLIAVSIAVAIGIYLVLQVAFNSWRLATLAFVGLPTALVGGIVLTWIWDDTASLGALLGLLAVFAIAVRNSVLLISRFQHLEEVEGLRFGADLIVQGMKERLAPILVTAMATALVMAPFAVMGGSPGLEIIRPMAFAIIGGLITTTIVNLFILPSLYLWMAHTSPAPAASTSTIGLESPGTAAD